MKLTRSLRVSTLGVLALSCGLTFAAPAAPPATVADLTVQLAVALGFEPAGPSEAHQSLLRAGIDLGSDLATPLTRERADDLLAQLGISAGPPRDPGAPVSTATVGLVARSAAEVLMATPAYPAPEAVPIDPSCFALPRPQCQSCCIQAAQQITAFPRTLYRICAMTCIRTTNPSPSNPG